MKLRPVQWDWEGAESCVVSIATLNPERPVVWLARVVADPGAHEQLIPLLSEEERAHWSSFRFVEDQQRYLFAHGLIRIVTGAYLNLPAGQVTFGRGPFGKPFVLRRSEDPLLFFNLAHSGDLVLLALSPSVEVGVDVERVDRALDWETFAERVFSPAERRQLDLLEPDTRRRAFFDGWTRKEACLKALGLGLSGDPRTIVVPLTAHQSTLVEAPQAGTPIPSRLILDDVELPAGYAGAAAIWLR